MRIDMVIYALAGGSSLAGVKTVAEGIEKSNSADLTAGLIIAGAGALAALITAVSNAIIKNKTLKLQERALEHDIKLKELL